MKQKFKIFFCRLLHPKYTEQVKIGALALSSLLITLIYFFTYEDKKAVPQDLRVNLNVMIPKNHVLFPVEVSNYESVSPLLDAYGMVQVFHPENGKLIAKNIKVLRAPKSPDSLAFLIPVNIAKSLASLGIEFKIVPQKYMENKKPQLALYTSKTVKKSITFGEG